jgi:hypothetical protein
MMNEEKPASAIQDHGGRNGEHESRIKSCMLPREGIRQEVLALDLDDVRETAFDVGFVFAVAELPPSHGLARGTAEQYARDQLRRPLVVNRRLGLAIAVG